MFRKLFDPRSSDDDTPYRQEAVSAAARFAQALEAKHYSQLWHRLVANDTKGVIAASAFLRHRDEIAEAFGEPAADLTQEFLIYALDNDLEGVRTGLWAGIRRQAGKYGWFRAHVDQAQASFLGGDAIVSIPSKQTPLIVPLLALPGVGYQVDLETFYVAGLGLRVQEFVAESRRATEGGDFQRAIRLLEDASRLERPYNLLQQHAWMDLFTEQRRAELRSDASHLAQIARLLDENRELASLDVASAVRRDEDQPIDFKQQLPAEGKKLAKLFAAFATGEGGHVYFGVIDSTREVVGIEEATTVGGRDRIRSRIDHICRDAVRPAIAPRIVFQPYRADVGLVMVPIVVIRPGPEPVYYVDKVPYVRRGQSAVPAEPHEVIELHRRYLVQQGWRPPPSTA